MLSAGTLRFQRVGEVVQFLFRLIFGVAVALLQLAGDLVALAGNDVDIVMSACPIFLSLCL